MGEAYTNEQREIDQAGQEETGLGSGTASIRIFPGGAHVVPEVYTDETMALPAIEDDEEIDDWGDQESTVVDGLGQDAWGDQESTGNGIGADGNTHPGQRTPPPELDVWRAQRTPQHSEAYDYKILHN